MPLSLEQLAKQIIDYQGSIIGSDGRMSGEFKRIFYGVVTTSNSTTEEAVTAAATAQAAADTAQTAATTASTAAAAAQTAADNAAGSGSYATSNSPKYWYSDASGTAPASDPTSDITITFYDQDDTEIAQRVLRGTLTSAAGTIAVTSVSSSGLTTSYSLTGDGTASVGATVTVTLSDGSRLRHAVLWGYLDISIGGEVGY